jgi:ketosteroid isomerase-like protein
VAADDVPTIRRMYERWIAGDEEAVYAVLDGEIVLNPDPEAFWVGVNEEYRGHDGVRRYMSAVYEAFEDYRPEVEEIRDAGRGRVLTLAIEHGRGRGSGAEVQAAKTAHLWTMRDGRAVRLDLFLDRERAFEAVGAD